MSNSKTSGLVGPSNTSAPCSIEFEKDVTPRYMRFQRVDVMFGEVRVAKSYAHALHMVIQSVEPNTTVSEQMLLDYLTTLLHLRVKYVRGEPLPRYSRDYLIPAFWLQYLGLVGEVRDNTLGIELSPTVEGKPPLGVEEMDAVSLLLRKVHTTVESGRQMPRDRDGDWNLMTLQCAEGVVLSHSPDVEPIKALMGSMFEMRQAERCFIPLVRYGDSLAYERYARELARS